VIRTFVDGGVLISAFSSRESASRAAALRILRDSGRWIVSNEFVRLEVLPKAVHNRRLVEERMYREFFEREVDYWPELTRATLRRALDLACMHGLGAVDAINASTALEAGVEEFITTEKATKPLFHVRGIIVLNLDHPSL